MYRIVARVIALVANALSNGIQEIKEYKLHAAFDEKLDVLVEFAFRAISSI